MPLLPVRRYAVADTESERELRSNTVAGAGAPPEAGPYVDGIHND